MAIATVSDAACLFARVVNFKQEFADHLQQSPGQLGNQLLHICTYAVWDAMFIVLKSGGGWFLQLQGIAGGAPHGINLAQLIYGSTKGSAAAICKSMILTRRRSS